jgi:hypothetical protein
MVRRLGHQISHGPYAAANDAHLTRCLQAAYHIHPHTPAHNSRTADTRNHVPSTTTPAVSLAIRTLALD